MNRPVNISIVLNGYVAIVGCQTIVFNDLDCLLTNLKVYLQDPDKAEKQFLVGAKNRKITMWEDVKASSTPPVGNYPDRPAIVYDPGPPGTQGTAGIEGTTSVPCVDTVR